MKFKVKAKKIKKESDLDVILGLDQRIGLG